MVEPPRRVQRALGAMREDVWSELQDRRIRTRLEEAVSRPAAHTSRRWLWAVAAALGTLCVVIATRAHHGRPIVSEGAAIGSDAEPTRAAFSDGSEVDVERGGQVRVVKDRQDETRVEVLAGRAEFEVSKRPNRPFVTGLRGVEVRVIGTHFSTELDLSRPPGVVRVHVDRGIVEVRRRSGEPALRLGAGDALDVALEPVSPALAMAAAPAAAPAAPSSTAPAGSSASAQIVPAPAPVDASKLFDAAKAARAAGDVDGAARSYAALLKQFPGDERAGVAALELGRLRMDTQHAYRAAAEAFRSAIAAAPNEGVREDALARLVDVLDAMHETDSCRKERSHYLQQYPRGLYVSRVERACKR
jgi:transmembrane sensor